MRLRDLAGLIVIDFIDMEQDRHNNAVERKLKDALRHDRARIQVGRISHFGLLEMSRQRLRPSLVETNFDTCPRCDGAGIIRSIGSASLHILRAIEEEGIRQRAAEITVTVPTEIALYLLNEKRDALVEVEQRYGFRVLLRGDETLIAPDHRLQTTRARGESDDAPRPAIDAEQIRFDVDEPAAAPAAAESEAEGDEQQPRRKRRSRRGRRRRDDAPRTEETISAGDEQSQAEDAPAEQTAEPAEGTEAVAAEGATDDTQGEGEQRKKRRRGRRGGRRRSAGGETATEATAESEAKPEAESEVSAEAEAPVTDDASDAPAEPPAEMAAAEGEEATPEPAEAEAVAEEPPPEKPKRKRATRSRAASEKTPRRRTRRKTAKDDAEPEQAPAEAASAPAEDEAASEPAAPAPEEPAAEPAPVGLAASADPEPAAGRNNGPAAVEEAEGEVQEIVNKPPETPRRGWWRRVLDS